MGTTSMAFQVGEPALHGAVSVTPLFPAVDPRAEYVTLAQALAKGLAITEVDEDGDVGELRVHNPTPDRVLLYDGEELAGAKQNRILNVSVLVEARTELAVPVSCVEAGRWQWETDEFRAAGRAPSPDVRRAKAMRLHSSPLARGLAQGEVWDAVGAKEAEHGFASPTQAHGDLLEHARPRMAQMQEAFAAQPGQCGMVLAYEGRVACMDAVSRPDAYTHLHDALLTGYVLDAMGHVAGDSVAAGDVQAFVHGASDALSTARRMPSEGLGDDMRLAAPGILGSALALDGEVIQVTAYRSDEAPDARPGPSRIARPTRRRMA